MLRCMMVPAATTATAAPSSEAASRAKLSLDAWRLRSSRSRRAGGAPVKRKRVRVATTMLAELPASYAGLLARKQLVGWSKPRLFEVKSGYLLCHAGADASDKCTVVDLHGCTVKAAATGSGAKWDMALFSPTGDRMMRLRASTADLRAAWVVALSGVRRRKLSDFEHVASLGSGAFGSVALVQERRSASDTSATSSSRLFALKSMTLRAAVAQRTGAATSSSSAPMPASSTRVAQERMTMQLVGDHPYVARLHYAFMDKQQVHYVQQLGAGGDLFDNLRAQPTRRFSEDAVRVMAAELVLAIGHLHAQRILHRDIKIENVLLDAQGHVLLADFGLAKLLRHRCRSNSFVGTERYCPPEMWANRSHGRAVDWWQLGCLIFELLTGRPPFAGKGPDALERAIAKGRVKFPSYVSPEARSLVTGLLAVNTWERLGSGDGDLEEVTRQPFFASIDWAKLAVRQQPPVYVPDTKATPPPAAAPPPAATTRATVSAPAALPAADPDAFLGFDYSWEDEGDDATASSEAVPSDEPPATTP